MMDVSGAIIVIAIVAGLVAFEAWHLRQSRKYRVDMDHVHKQFTETNDRIAISHDYAMTSRDQSNAACERVAEMSSAVSGCQQVVNRLDDNREVLSQHERELMGAQVQLADRITMQTDLLSNRIIALQHATNQRIEASREVDAGFDRALGHRIDDLQRAMDARFMSSGDAIQADLGQVLHFCDRVLTQHANAISALNAVSQARIAERRAAGLAVAPPVQTATEDAAEFVEPIRTQLDAVEADALNNSTYLTAAYAWHDREQEYYGTLSSMQVEMQQQQLVETFTAMMPNLFAADDADDADDGPVPLLSEETIAQFRALDPAFLTEAERAQLLRGGITHIQGVSLIVTDPPAADADQIRGITADRVTFGEGPLDAAAAQAVNEFVNNSIRTEGMMRSVLPPTPIGAEEEVDREQAGMQRSGLFDIGVPDNVNPPTLRQPLGDSYFIGSSAGVDHGSLSGLDMAAGSAFDITANGGNLITDGLVTDAAGREWRVENAEVVRLVADRIVLDAREVVIVNGSLKREFTEDYTAHGAAVSYDQPGLSGPPTDGEGGTVDGRRPRGVRIRD